MKKEFYIHSALNFILMCMAMGFAVQSVHAVTVENYLHVNSTTGGHSLDGTDGKDGQDGTDGERGEDGAHSINGVHVITEDDDSVFITTKSIINGQTVIDTTVSPSSGAANIATSTSMDGAHVSVAADAYASVLKGEQYIRIQELLASIQLILKSYVSHTL